MDFPIKPFESQQPSTFAFKIGDFEVQWYGIFFALGILFAIFFIITKLKFFHKIDDTPFYIFIFIAIPTMILGARAWSFIIGDSKIGITPFFDFANGFAGLAIQGAIILSTIVGLIWFGCVLKAPRYFANTNNQIIKDGKLIKEIIPRQVSMWVIADTLLPAILIGQAIGRWGNFFNHEVYGGIVQVANAINGEYVADSTGPAFTQWGFLKNFMPDVWNNMWIRTSNGIVAFRAPIFLIESFFNVIVFCFLFFGSEYIKGYRAGTNAFGYFLATGTIRLIIELFRDQTFQFETSIIISSLFIPIGIIGILCSYFVFVRLRKYRCIYYLVTKISFHIAALFRYITKQIKNLFSKQNKIKTTYNECFKFFDNKRRYTYQRSFWDQYYYDDNIVLQPYQVN